MVVQMPESTTVVLVPGTYSTVLVRYIYMYLRTTTTTIVVSVRTDRSVWARTVQPVVTDARHGASERGEVLYARVRVD